MFVTGAMKELISVSSNHPGGSIHDVAVIVAMGDGDGKEEEEEEEDEKEVEVEEEAAIFAANTRCSCIFLVCC